MKNSPYLDKPLRPLAEVEPLTAPPTPPTAPVIGLLADGRIVINTTLSDKDGVDDLITMLNALRVIAPDRAKADPPSPPTAEEVVGRIYEDGRAQSSGAAEVSLMITQAQKAQLRERGYTDEQIREMAPAEAHQVLGLVN